MPHPHILVVDDNEDFRELLCQYIEMLGYQPTPAADGKEALRILKGGAPPSLVLLDRHTPQLDGPGFLDAAGETLRGVPVVWMTGESGDVKHPSVIATLRKPFDLELLQRLLKERLPPLH